MRMLEVLQIKLAQAANRHCTATLAITAAQQQTRRTRLSLAIGEDVHRSQRIFPLFPVLACAARYSAFALCFSSTTLLQMADQSRPGL